uniref:SRCR domain-containing protein n=1 Tax=Terrapene triunguis TaxID=2587831 RepID=A0A674K0A5_9SAUR
EELRLADGGSPCAGRVEVKHQDQWGTVCDPNWDMEDAKVVCKQLGCGSAVSALGNAHFGEGSGRTWLFLVDCGGDESALWDCSHRGWGSCSHANDASAICSRKNLAQSIKRSHSVGSWDNRAAIRLTGFRLVLDTWGTLCDSRWDLPDANVLCRQLDCGFAESVPGGGYFGRGTGSVWTDTYHCKGTETHLGHCPVTALGASQCSHDNDASVICSGKCRRDAGLRTPASQCPALTAHRCDGRVEISLHGVWSRVLDDQWDMNDASVVCRQLQCGVAEKTYNPPNWGTVCDDFWDLLDSNVVCKQLGCGRAINATVSAHYGQGSGQIWLDDVNCSGNEANLWACPSRSWGQHNCRHKEDAGVLCSGMFCECSGEPCYQGI